MTYSNDEIDVPQYISDQDKIVCFGHEYCVQTKLLQEDENYKPLVTALGSEQETFWLLFSAVKKYYDEISAKQEINKLI